MQEVYDFLKKAGTYYLATVEGDQPRVRPFGTVNIFEGKLYIQTGKVKPCSKQMLANPKIEIRLHTEVADLGGDGVLSEIVLRNTETGELSTVKADAEDGMFGLFGFTGKKTTGMFEGILDMENGYIKTNEKMETNIPGVYAAGDVRVTPLRQVVTACADGAIAAMQCGKYINTLK